MSVFSITFHLGPLKSGLSLNLELGSWPQQTSCLSFAHHWCHGCVCLCPFIDVSARIQIQVLMLAQQAFLPAPGSVIFWKSLCNRNFLVPREGMTENLILYGGRSLCYHHWDSWVVWFKIVIFFFIICISRSNIIMPFADFGVFMPGFLWNQPQATKENSTKAQRATQ